MKRIARSLTWALGAIALVVGGLWLFGPYEDATLTSSDVTVQGDLDTYFAQAEAAFDDITPGVQKRIIWAGDAGAKTDWSILYVHGFSATSQEIRPVPDLLAEALGANLVYTRLQGHGRSGAAMASATVQGWVQDLDEGVQAARQAGRKVLILSTSTGGTLVGALAQDSRMMADVAGLIFVSPNFGLNSPLARLLTWPGARYWLPPLAGAQRSFEARNAAQATYWTTSYPSVSVMPMVALIEAVAAQDPAANTIPALFMFSSADQVVRADITAQVASRWGAPSTVVTPVMGPQDDPQSHVIAGDILSPGQTQATYQAMLDWVRALEEGA